MEVTAVGVEYRLLRDLERYHGYHSRELECYLFVKLITGAYEQMYLFEIL